MFLLMRENQPIGVFDKIQPICEQVEERITIDYLKFKDTELYDNEQFPLSIYLDMKILIVEKGIIAWVIPDFIYNEVAVYEVLNAENSGIIGEINKYNESLIYH